MSTNKNDDKIIALKDQIAIKKRELAKSIKFVPVTNCSIEFEGTRSNIQTLNKDQLIILAVKLNSYKLSADDLKIEYVVSGYKVSDWLTDIMSRVAILERKEEETKLKTMESKLDTLLSSEKKTELEVSEIEALLK